MLGVRSETRDASDPDDINRHQARVQAVVAFCPPEDLRAHFNEWAMSTIATYVGKRRTAGSDEWASALQTA